MSRQLKQMKLSAVLLLLAYNLPIRAQEPPQLSTANVSILEAARSVLAKHPLIAYQVAQIDIDRGLKLQASGAFDTLVQASVVQTYSTTPLTQVLQQQYALIGSSGSTEDANVTVPAASVSRLFRSGVSVSAGLTLSRDVDNIVDPTGINNATPVLQVFLPLLRGRGRQAVDAQEVAAQQEVDASLFDMTQQVSQLLDVVAIDYWNVVAAEKVVVIDREAEKRANVDFTNTQALVNADRLPRENLNDVQANLAQSMSTRIAAEQTLTSSQYQLASDMGLDAQEIVASLPMPSDDFPSAAQELPSVTTEGMHEYLHVALQNRSDYLAALTRVDEQKTLADAAKNRLLPQLNITATAGYTGLQEGRKLTDVFTSSASNLDGPNISAGISYSFPVRNETARGAFLQATATEKQADFQAQQISRAIAAAVAVAVQAVHDAALQTERAHTAVQFYRASLEGQREKFHVGRASVIDVLTVEDRLTTAMATEVQAQLSYTLALNQFRFATGTMVAPGKAVQDIGSDVFSTILPAGLLFQKK